MKKKGAVGLGINAIVIIILSIVILAGGIVLLFQFIGGAEDIKAQLDARTDQELERLLISEGKQVALPLHVARVTPDTSHVFGIGILNIGEQDATFSIEVEARTVPNNVDTKNWVLFANEFIIAAGNHHKEGILVNIPQDAPKGNYLFIATVFKNGNKYGNAQTFTVQVL